MLYIIHNDNIMISSSEKALNTYNELIQELPEDYEEGKYIIGDIEIEIEGEVITTRGLVPNPDWDSLALEKAKTKKYAENEKIREEFLVSGVIYKAILWDSDIEQKLNLSIQVSSMNDTDTVLWVGMDGITSVEMTKADLYNLGQLLTQMTAYVWQYKNPEIKMAIANAKTVEELEAIEIVYDLRELAVLK